ncbi:ATP synthase I chain [Methylobacter tundripaludum SV96]|jgi:ATP synthase protein I|uniref:ATP synthase I chain n=1 Tax=Methylobacter tundripaludum (strain ATCC BAA-1195 / DSM 17260 / SV96) TaxID=697282 RepID=G3IWU4_METTV|nr:MULTISPECIES: ATP synthase subunit I [Methylobacter]EGW23299.1 ATP synthase I chain [Methylobacter tundripaludum SV96]MDI1277373.1 ATP synthase subunit I [Methylobacter sp.]MDI1357939.1 ATP synthase subunit I [Methylobacter sp.]
MELGVTARNRSAVSKIISYQILMIIIMTAGFALTGGRSYALSAALGGAAAFIPNLYFALRVHKSAGQEARKIVRSFYAGESGKLLLTAALFFMIFQLPNIEILPLLAVYIAALSVFWFALLMR